MNIKEEYQRLASKSMNNDNFEHFLEIAQEISKHYSESQKQNVKQVNVKIQSGMQVRNIYNEQYQFEQAYMILFYHRYANMINSMRTPAEIGTNVRTSSFLTPAYYNPADKKISYKLDVIMREKSSNFANVMELCLHENRHAMQFESFSIDNPEDLIEFDPNSIFILKDYLVMLNGNYRNNHINSLMEIDANLYARGISRQLINQYFTDHQEDLKHTDFAFKEGITDNPFDELSEYGLISGDYVLESGKKVDRAIMMDKNLRSMISPQLVEQYPMLKLICKDGKFKTYSEIMADKQVLLQSILDRQSSKLESSSYNTESITEKEKVERLYGAIIQSDPMLYLESLLSSKQIQYSKVKELFSLHPTLLNEYQSQITEIFSRKSTEIDNSQINFFSRLSRELNIAIDLQHSNVKNISINGFTRNALNSGVRTETVKEADAQISSPRITEKETEQESNNLADLDEFIDFIDPNMINDSRFLALLRKYRTEDLAPEEYVAWVEKNYKKQIEQTSIEPVDNTEETIR